MALFLYLSYHMRPVSQVVVRFDLARVIARPITSFDSSRQKKQRLKLKKILIARLVADGMSRRATSKRRGTIKAPNNRLASSSYNLKTNLHQSAEISSNI